MEKTGQGVISQNDLMQRLVQAKKVLNKVETGEFERGNVNEDILRSDPEDLISNEMTPSQVMKQPPQINTQKIQESKLPDAIKRAMIENPIPQISLNDSLDLNFVEKTKRLMESEGVGKKTTPKSSTPQSNSGDLIKQLTPIIENIVRKTVMEIMDTKLNQILTAQQTLSINENLVLKVGDSVFKGKITGVNKSK
jgi:hypothetical protein